MLVEILLIAFINAEREVTGIDVEALENRDVGHREALELGQHDRLMIHAKLVFEIVISGVINRRHDGAAEIDRHAVGSVKIERGEDPLPGAHA